MTLRVYTARVTYAGPDRLDVTAKGRDTTGFIFAPSWDLLIPVIAARKAGKLTDKDWQDYVSAYLVQMRKSYRVHQPDWEALLSRDEVTLVCYCTDPKRCHRTVLAGLLVKCGAEYLGER